jgi:hypothetical protein
VKPWPAGFTLTTVTPWRARMAASASVLPTRSAGHPGLDDGEALVELEPVQHPPGHQVRHPLAHVVLREHHVVGPDALEDPAVGLGDRLGPDGRDAQVHQARRGQDAGLDVGADAHHRGLEVRRAQLAQHGRVGGVGLDHVGQVLGLLLDAAGRAVDAQHLEAQPHQLLGQRAAEAAEADHQDLAALGVAGQRPGRVAGDAVSLRHVGPPVRCVRLSR